MRVRKEKGLARKKIDKPEGVKERSEMKRRGKIVLRV
jgi:hypothetical protein